MTVAGTLSKTLDSNHIAALVPTSRNLTIRLPTHIPFSLFPDTLSSCSNLKSWFWFISDCRYIDVVYCFVDWWLWCVLQRDLHIHNFSLCVFLNLKGTVNSNTKTQSSSTQPPCLPRFQHEDDDWLFNFSSMTTTWNESQSVDLYFDTKGPILQEI